MNSLRIGAIYFGRQHVDYLANSILSIASSVESILIGLNRRLAADPKVLARLKEQLSISEKIEFVEGDWREERECFQFLSQVLAQHSFSHALLMSQDQVFSCGELQRILGFVIAHPETHRFGIQCRTYWKSPAYRIEPPDRDAQVSIVRIDDGNGLLNPHSVISVPEDVGFCHDFAYANPGHRIEERVKSLGLASDAVQKWKEIWEGWDNQRQKRNLHPLQPERFRSAVRINLLSLPEAMAHHPYLKEEIVGHELRKKPTLSVIFKAQSSLPRVQAFVENLARTVPDDIELIAVVSSQQTELLPFLESRPGVQVIVPPHAESVWADWDLCVQAAEGMWLCFLQHSLLFEGDWLEGIQAALEKDNRGVYQPRILNVEADSKDCDRQLQFEKRRGVNYGLQTHLDQTQPLEQSPCWACSRQRWEEIRQAQGADAAETFTLEDTLLFQLAIGDCQLPIEDGRQLKLEAPSPDLENHQSAIGNRQSSIPVSIIVPVYNNLHFTRACLESITQHTTPGTYEIIVVDNGSTDGTREYLESLQPKIRYLRNHRNLFFARGCNRGAWAATAENLLFLNNDTVVTAGWLDSMLEVLEQDPNVGIVGNKQLFPHSNPAFAHRVWHAGMVMTPEEGPWHIYYGFASDHPLINQQRDFPILTGCCLLVRRKLFEELRGFDPYFQNGYEDSDFCLRAGQLGYRLVYTPKSQIIHHVSSSESRFDRNISNHLKFQARWKDCIQSTEKEFYQRDELIPPPEKLPTTRVGVISTFNQKCALADYARDLVNEYPEDSYTVLGEFCPQEQMQGADPPQVLRAWDRSGSWHYPLLRLASSLDFNLIHVNFDFSIFGQGFSQWVKTIRQHGKKIVLTLHHTSAFASVLTELCELADAVIVHMPQNRQELLLHGCDESKIHVITPGVPSVQPFPITTARERMGIALSEKLIVTPGFISARKGILEVIQALAEIRQKIEVTYLVLGGLDPHQPDYKYLEKCKSAVAHNGLERDVLFFEEYLNRDELRSYLNCADSILLPYRSQQFAWSSAAALALSTSRPVIASSDPMFSPFGEAVLQTGAGISLAQGIYSVLTNPLLASQLVERGTAFAASHGWDRTAKEHWHVYQQVLEGKNHSGHSLFTKYQALRDEQRATEKIANKSPVLCWSGAFYDSGEHGESARSMALALSAAGLPLSLADFSKTGFSIPARTHLKLRGLQKRVPGEFLLHVDQRSQSNWERRPDAAWNIARYLLAEDRLPVEIARRLRTMESVWVASRFHYESCLNSGVDESRLLLLPETLDFSLIEENHEPLSIEGRRRFSFLSVLEWNRCKGWDVLIQAFLEEFKASEDVCLILASQSNDSSSQGLLAEMSHFVRSRLHKDPSRVQNILLLPQPLTTLDRVKLYKTCQSFVLPSRAEASGREVLTALAVGLPTIATPWGAHQDLVDPDWAYPIHYQLVDVPSRYRKGLQAFQGSRWAEPSVEHLREQMRHVYTNPKEAEAKSKKARQEVESKNQWTPIAALVKEQIQTILERISHPAQVNVPAVRRRPHICWEGPQLVNHSLALVNREMEQALLEAGKIDLSILPVGADTFATSLNGRTVGLTTHYGRQTDTPVDIHIRHQWPPNWSPPPEGRWVVIQPWEFGSLPVEWVSKINECVDEVWVPSTFVRKLYLESGVDPERVYVIPNGVETNLFRPGLKPFKMPTPKKFKFLFLGGTIHRKGPDLLLNAYQQAFGANDDVVLVIKDTGTQSVYQGQGIGEKILAIQKDPRAAAIIYLDLDLSEEEIAALYNACDCFVHPYRGEGFALAVLEAMSCGLPVIVTAGGATDDFVDDQCGFRIPSQRQVFGNREISGIKTVGDLWMLEPDGNALAERMRWVYEHRCESQKVGEAARQKVVQNWTWKQSAELVAKRIDSLIEKPIFRFQEKVDAAVLIELNLNDPVEFSGVAIASTIQSLKRNSYARLKIWLWSKDERQDIELLRQEHPDLVFVVGSDFQSVVKEIQVRVRASFLIIVSNPLAFSRQWFGQIAEAARQIGSAPKILAPSSNLEGSRHFIKYEGNPDEFSFQKFSRALWRNHRGKYQEISSLPLGCLAVSWDCLHAAKTLVGLGRKEWTAALKKSGVLIYWVQDTYVATLTNERIQSSEPRLQPA